MYTDVTGRNFLSKIPRSPITSRRRSVENLSSTDTGLPKRGIPQYKSLRKATSSSSSKEIAKDNTWSGHMTKKRTNLSNETYMSRSKPNSPSPSRRSPSSRSGSIVQYDQNGRRVKPISASANTSPIKAQVTLPIAQQFFEVAGQAKNDEQFLEKMKALLAQYTKHKPSFDDEDFTTAWVKSNRVAEHAKITNDKSVLKSSSESEKSEQNHEKEIPFALNTRRSSGLSRIPTPVRANTGLY